MFTLKRLNITRVRALASFALIVALTLVSGAPFATSARAVSSLPVMQNLTPEQIEAGVEEYFASAASLDVQRFVNNFAPDGVLEDPVGTPPVQGTQAIAAFYAAIVAPFSHIKPKVQEVIVGGNEAAVDWKLNLTTTDAWESSNLTRMENLSRSESSGTWLPSCRNCKVERQIR